MQNFEQLQANHLPVLDKLYMTVLAKRLPVVPFDTGCVQGTSSALFCLNEPIRCAPPGEHMYVCSMTLKAYDTVWLDGFFIQLHHMRCKAR
jgi:hypothetical protein